jgi:hypothetical protein
MQVDQAGEVLIDLGAVLWVAIGKLAQAAAIERARQMSPNAAVHVERVRYPRGANPDKWRKI